MGLALVRRAPPAFAEVSTCAKASAFAEATADESADGRADRPARHVGAARKRFMVFIERKRVSPVSSSFEQFVG